MELQRFRHDIATEQRQQNSKSLNVIVYSFLQVNIDTLHFHIHFRTKVLLNINSIGHFDWNGNTNILIWREFKS